MGPARQLSGKARGMENAKTKRPVCIWVVGPLLVLLGLGWIVVALGAGVQGTAGTILGLAKGVMWIACGSAIFVGRRWGLKLLLVCWPVLFVIARIRDGFTEMGQAVVEVLWYVAIVAVLHGPSASRFFRERGAAGAILADAGEAPDSGGE